MKLHMLEKKPAMQPKEAAIVSRLSQVCSGSSAAPMHAPVGLLRESFRALACLKKYEP